MATPALAAGELDPSLSKCFRVRAVAAVGKGFLGIIGQRAEGQRLDQRELTEPIAGAFQRLLRFHDERGRRMAGGRVLFAPVGGVLEALRQCDLQRDLWMVVVVQVLDSIYPGVEFSPDLLILLRSPGETLVKSTGILFFSFSTTSFASGLPFDPAGLVDREWKTSAIKNSRPGS